MMKRFLPLLLALTLLMTAVSAHADVFDTLNQMLDTPATSDTPATGDAPAAGDAAEVPFTVAKTAVITSASSSYVSANYMVEVTNTTDKPVSLSYDSIVLKVTDNDGNVVSEEEHVSVYPDLLLPGERAFGSAFCMFSIGSEIASADTQLNFEMKLAPAKYDSDRQTRFTLNKAEMATRAYYGGTYPSVRIEATNDSGKEQLGVLVSYGVYDAEDNLLYVGRDSVGRAFTYNAGAAVVYDDIVSTGVAEEWQKSGITPDHVKAIVVAYQAE